MECLSTTSPIWVSAKALLSRSINSTPYSSSNFFTAMETAGCVTSNSSDALVKFPYLHKIRKYSN